MNYRNLTPVGVFLEPQDYVSHESTASFFLCSGRKSGRRNRGRWRRRRRRRGELWERMCGIHFLFCSSQSEQGVAVMAECEEKTVIWTWWRSADSSLLLPHSSSPLREDRGGEAPPWPNPCWRGPSPGWEAETDPAGRPTPNWAVSSHFNFTPSQVTKEEKRSACRFWPQICHQHRAMILYWSSVYTYLHLSWKKYLSKSRSSTVYRYSVASKTDAFKNLYSSKKVYLH